MTTTSATQPPPPPVPARIDMHYTVDVNGATHRVELPFVVGVMADLASQPEGPAEPVADREFMPIDADSFDAVIAAIRPRVAFRVADELADDGHLNVDLSFECLDEFGPAHVARRVPALLELLEREKGDRESRARCLDKLLNLTLHHPSFQRLESTWRCLHRLVTQTETDDDLKILVMHVTMPELEKTLRRYEGTAWNQSPVFKRICDERYRAAAGEPFGCLLLDYSFSHHPSDVRLLRNLSMVGAEAFVPMIAAASPALFQMDSWEELKNPRQLTKIFTTPEYAAWQSLRGSEHARYLVLTLPRFVVRSPYERQAVADGYEFHEDATGYADILWGNAAYLLAENILRSFRIYGWPSRVSGLQTGGAVEGLPTVSMPRRVGPGHTAVMTDSMVTDRREEELVECGLTTLVVRGASGLAEFRSAVTLNRPEQYYDPDATANATAAVRLPYVLGEGRVAHYFQAMIRDASSQFGDRMSAEAWFNDWIADYVTPTPGSSGGDTSTPRPLAEARIAFEAADGGALTMKFLVRPNL